MSSQKLRVAVVGVGVGKQHAAGYKAFPNLYDLKVLCSLEADANTALSRELNIAETTTDFNQVLARTDIDVIDICTPPMLHLSQAKAALQAGKHVICEKPLTHSLAAVDELIAAERASGKRLMPIFQYRFGQGLQKLLTLKNAGLTGRAHVASVEVHWRRRAPYYAVPWRGKFATELGGAVTSHAIHALDMLTYVLGPVRRVFARTRTSVNPIEVEDGAAISLELADGSLATVSITLGSVDEITRHRFVFENLVAESNREPYTSSNDPWSFKADTAELAPAIEAALRDHEARVQSSAPAATQSAARDGHTLKGYAPPARYEAQIERFHPAIVNNTPFPVTLQDARNSIELLTTIYHSAETGQMVELPIANTHPKYRGWK